MPIPLLQTDQVMCAHGGKLVLVSSIPTAQILGMPMMTDTDVKMATIAGCPFNIAGAPKPCLKVVDTGQMGIKDSDCGNGLLADATQVSTAMTDNGVPLMLAGSPLAQPICQ